jgi:hypothetical protein
MAARRVSTLILAGCSSSVAALLSAAATPCRWCSTTPAELSASSAADVNVSNDFFMGIFLVSIKYYSELFSPTN